MAQMFYGLFQQALGIQTGRTGHQPAAEGRTEVAQALAQAQPQAQAQAQVA